jgi:outer membrane protein assembly factor BamE
MPRTNTRGIFRALALAAPLVVLLGACHGFPYKLDVPQGNLVGAEQLEKLEIGMTRNQVRFVLGTPLVTDPFHSDRWDYFYSFRHDDKVTTTKRITLVFTDDTLSAVNGDDVPPRLAGSVPARAESAAAPGTAAVLQ